MGYDIYIMGAKQIIWSAVLAIPVAFGVFSLSVKLSQSQWNPLHFLFSDACKTGFTRLRPLADVALQVQCLAFRRGSASCQSFSWNSEAVWLYFCLSALDFGGTSICGWCLTCCVFSAWGGSSVSRPYCSVRNSWQTFESISEVNLDNGIRIKYR